MANVIKLYRNGVTLGKSGMNKNPPKREKTTGWSYGTSRRMTKWLYSVDIDSLTGYGYSFTLTVKDCPDTPEAWQALRKAFIYRLKRRGLIRLHWLTEWQRRGVPHMHGCVYLENAGQMQMIKQQWIAVAEKYGASIKGQDSKELSQAKGWFKYLSKQAVRGVQHYQRSNDNRPKSWSKTGRMWGYWGDWCCDKPVDMTCDNQTYYKYRRYVRSWRKAKARDAVISVPEMLRMQGRGNKNAHFEFKKSRKNIVSARTLLKSNNRKLSEIRGVNEFIDIELSTDLLLVASAHEDCTVEDNTTALLSKQQSLSEIDRVQY